MVKGVSCNIIINLCFSDVNKLNFHQLEVPDTIMDLENDAITRRTDRIDVQRTYPFDPEAILYNLLYIPFPSPAIIVSPRVFPCNCVW
jgi:hypothetical protein